MAGVAGAAGASAGAAGAGGVSRRPLLVVLPACLAGAVLALAAAQPGWVRIGVPRSRPLADTVVAVAGHTLVPLIPALGLVGLAAVVGLLGVRGRGRTAVGAVLALTGTALLVAALTHLAAPSATTVSGLLTDHGPLPGRDPTRPVTAHAELVWPLLAALAGLLLAAAGALTALRGSRWPALSGRYDAAAARLPGPQPEPAPAGTASTANLWDALDRGDDPTA